MDARGKKLERDAVEDGGMLGMQVKSWLRAVSCTMKLVPVHEMKSSAS
jgi:hypothetical protein